MDQRGLIGRDSCSPLDPGPDSPVHHHFQRLPHLQPTAHGPNCQLKARQAPRRRRPLIRRYRRPPRCSNACAAFEQVMARRLRDAGWRISSVPTPQRGGHPWSVATDVRAVRSVSLLGDALFASTDGQSDRHVRSSGKLCELGAVSPWSRLRPRRKSVRLNRSVCGAGPQHPGRWCSVA